MMATKGSWPTKGSRRSDDDDDEDDDERADKYGGFDERDPFARFPDTDEDDEVEDDGREDKEDEDDEDDEDEDKEDEDEDKEDEDEVEVEDHEVEDEDEDEDDEDFVPGEDDEDKIVLDADMDDDEDKDKDEGDEIVELAEPAVAPQIRGNRSSTVVRKGGGFMCKGTKRLRRPKFVGIREAGLRRLAKRAGVRTCRKDVHKIVHSLIDDFVAGIVSDACAIASADDKKTLQVSAITYALKHHGRALL
jgi:histone H3/H4